MQQTPAPPVCRARSRLALLVRDHADAEEIASARAALEQAKVIAKIEKLIDAAPPLSDAERRRLADRLLAA
jgi:hypothetical protein